MSLIKWEPLGELEQFFDDRSFAALSRPLGFDLAIDVYEKEGNVIAQMSLPGLKPEDVEVSIEGDRLTVSGRREEEEEIKEKAYYSKEIRRGTFSRTTILPKAIEAGEVVAKLEDGMLSITLPVAKGTKENVVKVAVSS